MREELDADLCVVNGENVADGVGITPKLADKLLRAGADVVTLGNHTYRRDGIGDYLGTSEQVIRPANAGMWTPGRGLAVVEARNGVKAELAIARMRTRLPVRFEPADGGVRIEGVVIDCSDDGRASSIEPLRRLF